MAVEIKEDGRNFAAGSPRPLLETRAAAPVVPGASSYAVTRDGQRFMLITPIEESSASPITVVLNWTAGVRK
jgi:hypothetical protein